ncbi:mucin-17 [Hyalella azteca]|uniref:Mucin-17 n=1 Tax=Hyalella azteca TaxID=294128 RepID=A0A8B7NRA2_HYAAZ|nr:mucin-17 [Hyalella azteca]
MATISGLSLLLLLLVAGASLAQQERSISSGGAVRRRNRLPAGKSEVLDFSCPEDFGYYQHPTDCTQYYVCVFGGALQESCSGGLVYSHDLQTCDWPRNVVCNVDLSGPISTVLVTDPRTASPPTSQRSNLTPSVSSNGFPEALRTGSGRKELSGPSSNAVNRQGRIISSKDDPAQQDIRGRFQVQESTNRAFSVSPTTSKSTFSFPDELLRQKRDATDPLDMTLDERKTNSKNSRSLALDHKALSSGYPRIVTRGYDESFRDSAGNAKNFANFGKPGRFNQFTFIDKEPITSVREKVHDFFSLDSIEEDLDRAHEHSDTEARQSSNILHHRPIERWHRRRPSQENSNKRSVGPSAFEYNAAKSQLRFPFHSNFPAHISDAFRPQSFGHQPHSNHPPRNVRTNPSSAQPYSLKFHKGSNVSPGIQPSSGYSLSSSANPFQRFIEEHNDHGQEMSNPFRERPKPMPQEIYPFSEDQPTHLYDFGPPLHDKGHQRPSVDRPPPSAPFASQQGRTYDRPKFPIHIGNHDQSHFSDEKTNPKFLIASHGSILFSQPQPHEPNANSVREKQHAASLPYTHESISDDVNPTRQMDRSVQPVETLRSNQAYQNSWNDHTLSPVAPDNHPFEVESSDDILPRPPLTRYHEELDYPLVTEDYEYIDEYDYDETEPSKSNNFEKPNSYRPLNSIENQSPQNAPPRSRPEVQQSIKFTTPLPPQPEFTQRSPQLHQPKFTAKPPVRNRTPLNRQVDKKTLVSIELQESTPKDDPTTERPSRPTRPRIQIPVRRQRKTSTTTPKIESASTLKPFTLPPYDKPSSVRESIKSSNADKTSILVQETGRYSELSKLPDTSAAFKIKTDERQFHNRQNYRPALPGVKASSSSFQSQFDSRPQTPSFTNQQQQQQQQQLQPQQQQLQPQQQQLQPQQQQRQQSITPAPPALDDYTDLLNLTDAEYFYLYEDLLLEDYLDGSAGSSTVRPTTRVPIRLNPQAIDFRTFPIDSFSPSLTLTTSRTPHTISPKPLPLPTFNSIHTHPTTTSAPSTITSLQNLQKLKPNTIDLRLNLTDNLLQYQDIDPAPSFSMSSPLHSNLPTSSIIALPDTFPTDESPLPFSNFKLSQTSDRPSDKAWFSDPSSHSSSNHAKISSKSSFTSLFLPESEISLQDQILPKRSNAPEKRLKILVPKSLRSSSTSIKTSASAIIRPVSDDVDDIVEDELEAESTLPEEPTLITDEPFHPIDSASDANISTATNDTTPTNNPKVKVVAASYKASDATTIQPFHDNIDVLPLFPSNRTTPASKSILHPKPLPNTKPLAPRTNLQPIVQLSPNASFVRILSRQLTDGPSPVQSVRSIKKLRLRSLSVSSPLNSTTEQIPIYGEPSEDQNADQDPLLVGDDTVSDDYVFLDTTPKEVEDNAVDDKSNKKLALLFPKRFRTDDIANTGPKITKSTTTASTIPELELFDDLAENNRFPRPKLPKLSSVRNSLSAVSDSIVSISPSYRLTSRLSSNHPAAKIQLLSDSSKIHPNGNIRARFRPPSISTVPDHPKFIPSVQIKFPPSPITHEVLKHRFSPERFTNLRKEPLTESPNKLELTTTPTPKPGTTTTPNPVTTTTPELVITTTPDPVTTTTPRPASTTTRKFLKTTTSKHVTTTTLNPVTTTALKTVTITTPKPETTTTPKPETTTTPKPETTTTPKPETTTTPHAETSSTATHITASTAGVKTTTSTENPVAEYDTTDALYMYEESYYEVDPLSYTDQEYIEDVTETSARDHKTMDQDSPSTERPKSLPRPMLPFPKRSSSTTPSSADVIKLIDQTEDIDGKSTSTTVRPILKPIRPAKESSLTGSPTDLHNLPKDVEQATNASVSQQEHSNTTNEVLEPFGSDFTQSDHGNSSDHTNSTLDKEKSKSHPLLASLRSRVPFLNDDDSGLDSSNNTSSASDNGSSKPINPEKNTLNPLLLLKNTASLRQVEASNNSSSLNSSLISSSTSVSPKPNAGRLGHLFPTPRSEVAKSLRQSSQPKTQSSKASPVDSSRPSRLTLKPVSEIVKNTDHQITNIWKYPARRPPPVYPQPPYNSLATACDRKLCRLPDCNCGGKEVPNGIAPQDVPQMVLLTFDDSVNDLNKELYQDLFERGRTNPNGCPIAATFYISHEWTDYSQVQNLYADGHEIASHSITHSFGEQFSKLKWAKEIAGQREIMSAYGGVRMEDVRGMRAPFLAVGGNKMFEMLYEQNFTYDSSMPVYENRPPSYPYTLDYKLFHDCMIPPCPTNSFPGLWEVPMVMWQDLNGGRCSMGDACTTPPDAEGVYKMLIKNFERHYTTNRAPMGLFYHAAWFTTAHHKEGFIAFLDTISGMPDVWLVTNWQALQWMRDPVPLSQAKSFKPFQCNYPERPARCTSHRVCNVWHKGGVRYMRTCQKCPEAYPWVGATGVASPLND